MEVALKAIAHPTRRAILRLVWDAERTAGELADRTGMSGPATSQHLKVLRDADLVTVRADATRRYYRANHVRLQELRALLEDFWGERLAQLQQTAESFHDDPSPG